MRSPGTMSSRARVHEDRRLLYFTSDHEPIPLTRRFTEDFLSLPNKLPILDLEELEPCDEVEPTLVTFSTTRPVRPPTHNVHISVAARNRPH